MMTVPEVPGEWRKSSFSAQDTDCVELHPAGAVRDSKNPAAGLLKLPWSGLVAAVKANQIR